MRAAIYARKSNDDNDRNAENKSVTRQVERSREFIAKKGWTVKDEHIYVDDGISGAEFKKRPGLLRMLGDLKQIDVIVTMEHSRLGREQTQTSQVLAQIYTQGRRVFYYLTDEEVKFETALDKFMVGAVAFGAELEREKAAQRSYDALERKAAKGYNAGGACYGYDNVPVYAKNASGEQVKSHTDYRINERQAENIRAIFCAYADGYSHTVIAKALNGNGGEPGRRHDLGAVRERYFAGCDTSAPQQGKRGTGSWAPSAIREILYRERYTGKVPFDGMLIDRPDLRIVPDALWQRVQQRLLDVRATYIRNGGEAWGRPSHEKYLLSGLARCACCDKSITVLGGTNGNGDAREPAGWYACSYNHNRGRVVCANDHRAPMEQLDGAVIGAIKEHVLVPEGIAYTMAQVAAIVEQELKQNPDKPKQLEADARQLRREIERYVAAVAKADDVPELLLALKQRKERLAEVERQQAAVVTRPPVWTPTEVRAMCGEQLHCLEQLLLGDVARARQALRKLLSEPLRLSPATADGRRTLRFEGVTTLGPLLQKAWRPHGDSNPGYRRERAMS